MEFKFGDIVKFSEQWFFVNQFTEERRQRTIAIRMIVIGQRGDIVTVAKKGCYYSQTYHESFLEKVDPQEIV